MKADLTRNTFDPFKHFSHVLLQQGRVQLDADWNERDAILLRFLRRLAADFLGPSWGGGFAVLPLSTGQPAVPITKDFLIGAGHYYLDGILCELESTPVALIPNTPQPVMTGRQIRVSSVWVDGQLFQPGQYIELVDSPPPPHFSPSPVNVWGITAVDAENRILTLDQEVAAFLNAAGFAKPAVRRLITYLTQPDYPVAAAEMLKPRQAYQIYLDVWERLITYIEDDAIREVGLGGPDTASRAKTVWQVKAAPVSSREVCMSAQELRDLFQAESRGRLKARVPPSPVSTDPCILSPKAGYRGPENQLYRVEIHRSGLAWDGTEAGRNSNAPLATFKWSRENGSVSFPIVAGGGTTEIFLETLGRDGRLGLAEGDWVEVVDDDYALQGGSANLLQIQSVDRASLKVTVVGTPSDSGKDLAKHPLLRRWDHQQGNADDGGLQLDGDGAALIVEQAGKLWLSLEDGVQIQFQKPDDPALASRYRAGDYWLIPARTATGDVEWPRAKDSQGNPLALPLPPHGVEHHYTPLALVQLDEAGNLAPTPCFGFESEPPVRNLPTPRPVRG